MTRPLPILVLDFDGVLHSYTSGWKGADVVSDPPVPGAKEFLEAAAQRFQVAIVSSRSHEQGGRDAMARWMIKHFGGIGVGDYPTKQLEEVHLTEGGTITFPLHKPPAFLTIDDRAIQFTGEWPDVDGLAAFKPWNKKDGDEKSHMPLGDASDPPVDQLALDVAREIWRQVPELLERSKPQGVSRIQILVEGAIRAALKRHKELDYRHTR